MRAIAPWRHVAANLWAALVALPHTGFYRFMYRIWRALLLARVALVVAALALLAFDAAVTRAHAQAPTDAAVVSEPSAETRKNVYFLALVCHTANKFAGDETKAQQSYQVVEAVGHSLGIPESEIADDLDRSMVVDTGSFNRNRVFFENARKNCVSVGLM